MRAVCVALALLVMASGAASPIELPGSNAGTNDPPANNLFPRTNWNFSPGAATDGVLNEKQDAICLALGCASVGGAAQKMAPPTAGPASPPAAAGNRER